jgi:hypothetical protein
MPGYHRGRAPRNKGLRYPADPPTIEEIVAVMRAAGDGPDGARLCALIVMLWRAGLRISEALDLAKRILTARAAPCWSGEARAGSAARSGWTAGPEISCSHGSRSEAISPSGLFSARSTTRPLVGAGSLRPLASNSDGPPLTRVFVAASRRTN